jgi:hypothetical protein
MFFCQYEELRPSLEIEEAAEPESEDRRGLIEERREEYPQSSRWSIAKCRQMAVEILPSILLVSIINMVIPGIPTFRSQG